jgi:hypothetical protein
LSFDPADVNQDGMPDAVTCPVPGAFAKSVAFNGSDLDSEIDIAIYDGAPPFSALPDGTLCTIQFTAVCPTPITDYLTAPVNFSDSDKATFGDTNSVDIPGQTVNGSVRIYPGLRGDCNGDGKVSSADITACISEIFDGDGDLAQNTPGGTYAGNPIGCDPNCDGRVTSADITCTITRIFGGTCGVCP